MRKNNHTITFLLLVLSFVLLFSIFLLAGCGTDAHSPTQQAAPTAGNTVVDDSTKPDKGTSTTATPDATGFDCANVGQIPFAECQALVAVYNSTNGPEWVNNSGWLASDTPCTWLGIDCRDDHVSQINLSHNRLTGILPPELGKLTQLRVLILRANQLHEPIPAELINLRYLQDLSLAQNQLGGSIPSSLGKRASLASLDLSYNQFSGAIPEELGNLINLRTLYLAHNTLSGNIPAALVNLSKLEELDLSYNQLHGSVPESISFIDRCSLWGNQLEGTITSDGQELIVVDYEGIHFTIDPSLAKSIWPEVVPATPLPEVLEGPAYWLAMPEHIRFTFADPHLWPGRQRMGINLAAEAQILVFPATELEVINPLVERQIETLRELLVEKGTVPVGELPLLPLTNSAQVFHAQAQYLVFDNIQGLRFISQHTQDPQPIILNQEIFYTFQGLTNDGAFYIAAFFPVTTAILPDSNEVEDWTAFNANYSSYLSGTITVLNQQPPEKYRPDLTLLDAVIASLRLEQDSTLNRSLLVIRPALFPQGYYHEKD